MDSMEVRLENGLIGTCYDINATIGDIVTVVFSGGNLENGVIEEILIP